MKKRLLALCFVEGATVMAAELCGAKLLAPVFGSSLYVWASVMGITLGGLATGYFFGGFISVKRSVPARDLSGVLIAASLFLLLMPVVSHYLVPRISYLSFLPAVVLSTFLLLFLPVFFLGAASPLFVRLQTLQVETSGKASGTVYAVSTAGGICSTFACGFYLIPELGLQLTMLLSGSLLLLATLGVLRKAPVFFVLFGGIFISYLGFQIITGMDDVIFRSDSVLGHVEISDQSREGTMIRYLTVNDIIQSEMDLATGQSVSSYIKLLDTLIPVADGGDQALVLGLGGGLTANNLVKKKYLTVGVEFDDRIAQAASDYFDLSPAVKVKVEDARVYLNKTEEKFRIILADLFKAEEQPSHVLTTESLRRLRRQLSDNGMLFITWHGFTAGREGQGSAILYNTLKEAGFEVKLFSNGTDPRYRNVVFAATLRPFAGPRELELQIPSGCDKINSDDHPLLEKHNALANKAWRTSYLRYYQRVSE